MNADKKTMTLPTRRAARSCAGLNPVRMRLNIPIPSVRWRRSSIALRLCEEKKKLLVNCLCERQETGSGHFGNDAFEVWGSAHCRGTGSTEVLRQMEHPAKTRLFGGAFRPCGRLPRP